MHKKQFESTYSHHCCIVEVREFKLFLDMIIQSAAVLFIH